MSDSSPVSGARTTQWNAYGNADTDARPISAPKGGGEKEAAALNALTASAPTNSAPESTPKGDLPEDPLVLLEVAGYTSGHALGENSPPITAISGVLTMDDPDVLGVTLDTGVRVAITRDRNPGFFDSALTVKEKYEEYLAPDGDPYGRFKLGGYGVLEPNDGGNEALEELGVSRLDWKKQVKPVEGIDGVLIAHEGDQSYAAIRLESGANVVVSEESFPILFDTAFSFFLKRLNEVKE